MSALEGFQAGWVMMLGRFAGTYRQRQGQGVVSTAISNAWRRNLKRAEGEPSLGAYVMTTQDFGIPKVDMPDITPTPADIFDFGSETWTVLEISEWGALGSWRLSCIKMAINSALSDTLTIRRPKTSATADGRRTVEDYTIVAENVPCKIQVVDSLSIVPIQAEGRLGKWMMPSPFKCYLSYNIDVNAQDQGIDQNGLVYTISNVTNPEKLDHLSGIDLMRLP